MLATLSLLATLRPAFPQTSVPRPEAPTNEASVRTPAETSKLVSQFQAELDTLHAEANLAKSENNFQHLEELRQRRRGLLLRAQEADIPWKWADAYAHTRNAKKLFLGMNYDSASNELLAAWELFEGDGEGTAIFGDIATTFFEVIQGAMVVRPNAMDQSITLQDKPEQTIHVRTAMRHMLERAVADDPCQVEATTMLAFLEMPGNTEAFRPAEDRPSRIRHNQQLLALSANPDVVEMAGAIPMPWHAPAEYLKGRSNARILDDLRFYSDFLNTNKTMRAEDARREPIFLCRGNDLLGYTRNRDNTITPSIHRLSETGEWGDYTIQLLEVSSGDDGFIIAEPELRQKLVATLSTNVPTENDLGKEIRRLAADYKRTLNDQLFFALVRDLDQLTSTSNTTQPDAAGPSFNSYAPGMGSNSNAVQQRDPSERMVENVSKAFENMKIQLGRNQKRIPDLVDDSLQKISAIHAKYKANRSKVPLFTEFLDNELQRLNAQANPTPQGPPGMGNYGGGGMANYSSGGIGNYGSGGMVEPGLSSSGIESQYGDRPKTGTPGLIEALRFEKPQLMELSSNPRLVKILGDVLTSVQDFHKRALDCMKLEELCAAVIASQDTAIFTAQAAMAQTQASQSLGGLSQAQTGMSSGTTSFNTAGSGFSSGSSSAGESQHHAAIMSTMKELHRLAVKYVDLYAECGGADLRDVRAQQKAASQQNMTSSMPGGMDSVAQTQFGFDASAANNQTSPSGMMPSSGAAANNAPPDQQDLTLPYQNLLIAKDISQRMINLLRSLENFGDFSGAEELLTFSPADSGESELDLVARVAAQLRTANSRPPERQWKVGPQTWKLYQVPTSLEPQVLADVANSLPVISLPQQNRFITTLDNTVGVLTIDKNGNQRDNNAADRRSRLIPVIFETLHNETSKDFSFSEDVASDGNLLTLTIENSFGSSYFQPPPNPAYVLIVEPRGAPPNPHRPDFLKYATDQENDIETAYLDFEDQGELIRAEVDVDNNAFVFDYDGVTGIVPATGEGTGRHIIDSRGYKVTRSDDTSRFFEIQTHTGTFLTDPTVNYTRDQYRDLDRNIVNVFMPRSLCLESGVSLWNYYLDMLQRPTPGEDIRWMAARPLFFHIWKVSTEAERRVEGLDIKDQGGGSGGGYGSSPGAY